MGLIHGYDDFVLMLAREPERADRLEAALRAARLKRVELLEEQDQLALPAP